MIDKGINIFLTTEDTELRIFMAFFLQGDSLLLPLSTLDSQITDELHVELSNQFDDPDVFKIGAIDVVSVSSSAIVPDNWKKIPVRQLLAMFSVDENSFPENNKLPGVLRACHIAQWKNESVFCGTCGAKNNFNSLEVCRQCPACGRLEYPRICPAILAVITDDQNRILLAHNKKFRDKVYSHISGFNEAGETLEDTVKRETLEEINIEVCNIEYIKSQSWPFPNSLMIGFKARYLSGQIKPDGTEIEDAAWFTKDNLPELPGQGSLSKHLINRWLNGSL